VSSNTDAISFVGSIGGVANAVDGLFQPIGSDWESALQPASFGGVPFGVTAASTRAGRRQVVHVYPYRNDVWIEDQGKQPRQFHIHGFLVEDSLIYGGGGVIAQREALLSVCEAGGTNTLVHPTYGVISSINCLNIEIEERKDLGRVFEFTMLLMISGVRQYPGATQSIGDVLLAAADSLRDGALVDLARHVVADVQYGAAVVNQAVSTVLGYYQTAVGVVNSVNRVFNSVSTLSGNFGRLFGGGNTGYSGANTKAPITVSAEDLLAASTAAAGLVLATGATLQLAAADIADTEDYGVAANDFVQSVSATAVDPSDGMTMLSSLADYQASDNTTDSPIGQAMSDMGTACAAHLRRVTVAALAETCAQYQPSSQNQAVEIQISVTSIIDSEILIAGDAGDDTSYDALRALRRAVVTDLQQRGAGLSAIADFNFNASQPSLALANRIYRDPMRADGLVRQVNPIHPAFMPTSFQALAN